MEIDAMLDEDAWNLIQVVGTCIVVALIILIGLAIREGMANRRKPWHSASVSKRRQDGP